MSVIRCLYLAPIDCAESMPLRVRVALLVAVRYHSGGLRKAPSWLARFRAKKKKSRFNLECKPGNSGLSIIQPSGALSQMCQKSYHRDNWLVAAKRSQRRCFLILRCRLFLSLPRSRSQVLDCSSTNRERAMVGLDRRETGQFYPTDEVVAVTVIQFSTRGAVGSHIWQIRLM